MLTIYIVLINTVTTLRDAKYRRRRHSWYDTWMMMMMMMMIMNDDVL